MKVIHVAETIKGGVATVLNELITSQSEDSDICDLRIIIPDSQKSELNFYSEEKIKTFKREKRGFYSSLLMAGKFVPAILKFKPDIIHLHSTYAGFVCRFILLFLPFIKSKVVYCPHAFSFMMSTSKVNKLIYAYIEKILQYKADLIICVSQYEFDEAVKIGIRKEKLVVIHNGVSYPNTHHLAGKVESYKRRIGDSFVVLFVGRFDYQKGFDLLKEVISKLSHTEEKIKFKIVGDYVGYYEEKQYIFHKNADYLGWLPKDEVSKIYKEADLIVIPSRWEGFAMVPIESFKEKIPVLSSDFPSFNEIITENKTGFTFKNGCSESLLKKILEIYHLPDRDQVLSDIVSNAFNSFCNLYTAEEMYKKTKSVYLDCLSVNHN